MKSGQLILWCKMARISDEEERTMIRMTHEGYSPTRIAKHIRRDDDTVRSWLRKAGLGGMMMANAARARRGQAPGPKPRAPYQHPGEAVPSSENSRITLSGNFSLEQIADYVARYPGRVYLEKPLSVELS